MNYTISDLKKTLGGGISTNKFLLEMESPILGVDSSKLNLLCKNAKFPERTVTTSAIWNKGRKYNVRAETNYNDSIVLTFLDDDKATLRKLFDAWMKDVDDSSTPSAFDFSSYERAAADISNLINGGADAVLDILAGKLNPDIADAIASYQNDFNIWALDSNRNKVYGYKVQNCFPTGLGEVEFSDESQNKLMEFQVTFTFSEFIPLDNTTALETIVDMAIGDLPFADIAMEKLFD